MDKPLRNFATRKLLDERLAGEIANELRQAISDKGHASLAVSGGNTPKQLFKKLSRRDLPWSSVAVTLADERCVAPDSENSNHHLVSKYLLRNRAADAVLHSLNLGAACLDDDLRMLERRMEEARLPPFDVLILGMGEDGHTASLFPCAAETAEAMAPENRHRLMKVQPASAPFTRITFTLNALLDSGRIFLHLVGDEKLMVLRQALSDGDELAMPIRAFLHRPNARTEIFWAPA